MFDQSCKLFTGSKFSYCLRVFLNLPSLLSTYRMSPTMHKLLCTLALGSLALAKTSTTKSSSAVVSKSSTKSSATASSTPLYSITQVAEVSQHSTDRSISKNLADQEASSTISPALPGSPPGPSVPIASTRISNGMALASRKQRPPRPRKLQALRRSPPRTSSHLRKAMSKPSTRVRPFPDF